MDISALIEELNCIYRAIVYGQSKVAIPNERIHPEFQQSAKNLFHYLVLRSFDLRPYQDVLSELGLSSLRTAEGYVLANLHNVIVLLKKLNGDFNQADSNPMAPGFQESRHLLNRHVQRLFGASGNEQRVRIMVTLPEQAAYEEDLVYRMAKNGMKVARINLGRDHEGIWKSMVDTVRRVERKLGRPIKIYMDLAGPKIRTGQIGFPNKKGKEKKRIPVREGERILLSKMQIIGVPSKFNKKGVQLSKAKIAVSLPQVIDDASINDAVLFDDGMIRAQVVGKDNESLELEIKKCFKFKLGAQKGINLPDTKLYLPALTEEDIKVLPFVCEHADILGYSFVRSANDVALLYRELDKLQADTLGVVFKIENQEAFENFPNILFKGMERNGIGVMIARGDLAVEMGFERISEVQKELLWLCEAAHIPVIWATQVLENLAKKGIASRAEISDAAEGARAECVMLNKGPHIHEAIHTLRTILDKMDGHMSKKKESLRALNIANTFLSKNELKLVE